MVQTDRENIAMGYSADEIAAFAVLCDERDIAELENEVYALQGWNNASVNAAKVASWMEQLPAGSYLKNKYLATELAKSPSDKVAYWNAMLALKGNNQYVWVAGDSEHMCCIRPGYSITTSSQPFKVATVYLPHEESCAIVLETYDTATTVSAIMVVDGEKNWSALVQELNVLTTALTTEQTTRANAIAALHYFGTIGGAVATQGNDALAMTGTDGVSVTASGKTITVSGATIHTQITNLTKFDSQTLGDVWVRDLKNQYSGTFIESNYMSNWQLMAQAQIEKDYWNDILNEISQLTNPEDGLWVPFDATHVCHVRPGINHKPKYAQGECDATAMVYIPHTESYWVMGECYNGQQYVVGYVERVKTGWSMGDVFALIDN